MDRYFKGCNVEQEEVIPDDVRSLLLDDQFNWIKVKPGSEVKGLIHTAASSIGKEGQPRSRMLVLSGSGAAVSKVVTVAEGVKRKQSNLYQMSKIFYLLVEEYWEPKCEELESLKVTRHLPAMIIVLSVKPFESALKQTRHTVTSFLNL